MQRIPTLFLKFVILLFAVLVLAWMFWLPQIEGRNVDADLLTIYFRDPFLAYAYLVSVPFFMALYNAYRLLGCIEKNQVFSSVSVMALHNIKLCIMVFITGVIGAIVWILVNGFGKDDVAGGVVMGLFAIVLATIAATAAAVFERLLQNALDIKSENDLTV